MVDLIKKIFFKETFSFFGSTGGGATFVNGCGGGVFVLGGSKGTVTLVDQNQSE